MSTITPKDQNEQIIDDIMRAIKSFTVGFMNYVKERSKKNDCTSAEESKVETLTEKISETESESKQQDSLPTLEGTIGANSKKRKNKKKKH